VLCSSSLLFFLTGFSFALAQQPFDPGAPVRDSGDAKHSASGTGKQPETKVNGVPVSELMKRLGFKMEAGVSLQLLDSYADHFDRTDPNRDGKHTKAEYVDGGRYMTPQARAGIFNAADENQDRVVTRSEYVLNRIITDEGKEIIQAMDSNRNGTVESAEFVHHSAERLGDVNLATAFFQILDRNGDGAIHIPEYLRVWGQLAREGRGDANERIKRQRERLANQVSGKQKAAVVTPDRDEEMRSNAGFTTGRSLRGRPNVPPPVDQVFARFDKNGDDRLVESEIAGFVRKYILPADTNHDGAVTKQELEAYRKKIPAGQRPSEVQNGSR